MASKTSKSQPKKKQRKGEGSSSAPPPEYDSHRFLTKEHEERYNLIKNWKIIKKRAVKLKQGNLLSS